MSGPNVPVTNPQQIATDNTRNDLLGAIQQAIKGMAAAFAAGTTKALIIVAAEGQIQNNELLPSASSTLTVTFATGLPGATGFAITAPTSDATFTVKLYPGATTVFTAKFPAGVHIPTFTCAAPFVFGPGQALVPFGPSPADITLSDVTIAIQGT